MSKAELLADLTRDMYFVVFVVMSGNQWAFQSHHSTTSC